MPLTELFLKYFYIPDAETKKKKEEEDEWRGEKH